MERTDEQARWESYTYEEISALLPVLESLGYALLPEQPHITGERYLMQAVTTASGKKVILLGVSAKDGKKVVIKSTRDEAGKRELAHERVRLSVLNRIRFAYEAFMTPEELAFIEDGGRIISIHAFIEQERSFLARPIEEQFALALRAFKSQESAHAATYRHFKLAESTFGSMGAQDYLRAFARFRSLIIAHRIEDKPLASLLDEASTLLRENEKTVEQYDGFLTHTDFVPHNFRIVGDDIYLLDHSSLRFGNKYEGWARFLNFMTLYHPELERALTQYVRDNRTPEESLSLRLMRVYRLGEIIWYYTNTLAKASGDLHALNSARIAFWTQVLDAVLHERPLPEQTRAAYQAKRDALRSDDEKRRQIGLH